jgi:hypothetical protein
MSAAIPTPTNTAATTMPTMARVPNTDNTDRCYGGAIPCTPKLTARNQLLERLRSHASWTDAKISNSCLTSAAARAATTGPVPVATSANEIADRAASAAADTRASTPAFSMRPTPRRSTASCVGDCVSSSVRVRCSVGAASPVRSPLTRTTLLPWANRCTLTAANPVRRLPAWPRSIAGHLLRVVC